MQKAVFIDFDGTFAHRGEAPPEHVEAVRRARANGHLMLLCTGRPKSMVPRHILDEVFDGLVGAAGGYVEVGGKVLADTRFPCEVAAHAVHVLTGHDVTFILEAPESVYSPVGTRKRMRDILDRTLGSAGKSYGEDLILQAIVEVDDLSAISFGKVSVFASRMPVAELADMIGPLVGALPNSVTGLRGHAGEIYLRGVNKAVGIDLVAAHLGIARSDIIGIGDGYNDLDMLAQAGTAVVVEDAPAEVLALADHIIAGPSTAGLVRGLADLGLIAPS